LEVLGEGYVRGLREAYNDAVPDGVDLVLYWWYFAASLLRAGRIKQFGLITTNSITQTFSRRVVATALATPPKSSIVFAIADHPWVQNADGAAVRISMTVVSTGEVEGVLGRTASESITSEGSVDVTLQFSHGRIQEDLRIGAALTSAVPLKANSKLASTGLILGSRGFVLTDVEATRLRSAIPNNAELVFPLYNGNDLTDRPRNAFVIDTAGWSEADLRQRAPAAYQRLKDRVFPERQTNRDPRLRQNWWLFRRTNAQVRSAIAGLPRFIATPETSKHRFFVFVDASIKPEHRLIVTGSDDAWILGVLSSSAHIVWALEIGGTLEDRPVYNKSRCFDCFPFPGVADENDQPIRLLGEQIDAHRKRQQAAHSDLTITGMYNVLEKLRGGDALTPKELAIHEKGLVSVLKQLHDDLDAAVFDAYGWPHNLSDEEILERLVALNKERAAEEARGQVRWLRPEFQKPAGQQATQTQFEADDVEGAETTAAPVKAKKQAWPATLPERISAVRHALNQSAGPVTAADVAKLFTRARKELVEELLDTLVAVGQARETEPGRYAP
jgi:hypothetical protein